MIYLKDNPEFILVVCANGFFSNRDILVFLHSIIYFISSDSGSYVFPLNSQVQLFRYLVLSLCAWYPLELWYYTTHMMCLVTVDVWNSAQSLQIHAYQLYDINVSKYTIDLLLCLIANFWVFEVATQNNKYIETITSFRFIFIELQTMDNNMLTTTKF